jgi:hypothetical protein
MIQSSKNDPTTRKLMQYLLTTSRQMHQIMYKYLQVVLLSLQNYCLNSERTQVTFENTPNKVTAFILLMSSNCKFHQYNDNIIEDYNISHLP